jgi:hypothetical protein
VSRKGLPPIILVTRSLGNSKDRATSPALGGIRAEAPSGKLPDGCARRTKEPSNSVPKNLPKIPWKPSGASGFGMDWGGGSAVQPTSIART